MNSPISGNDAVRFGGRAARYVLPDLPPFRGAARDRTSFLCAEAGWGNRRAAEALAGRIGDPSGKRVRRIEDFLPEAWVRRDFGRHRRICERAPWVLALLHALGPLHYAVKRLAVTRGDVERAASGLGAWLRTTETEHLVVTNHRAAFWAVAAKASGRADCAIWCAITDYALSAGWRSLDWRRIDGSFGPVPARAFPEAARRRHLEHPIAVSEAFERIPGKTPGKKPKRFLVTGGGWGLGPLDRVAERILASDPESSVRVCSGQNSELIRKTAPLRTRFGDRFEAGPAAGLESAMEWADVIVCRPGGMTLAEAEAAGVRVLLLPGLPGVESQNALKSGARNFWEPKLL